MVVMILTFGVAGFMCVAGASPDFSAATSKCWLVLIVGTPALVLLFRQQIISGFHQGSDRVAAFIVRTLAFSAMIWSFFLGLGINLIIR
jgi:RsiW-degrading membrane proteinase PrsW (M82 family)